LLCAIILWIEKAEIRLQWHAVLVWSTKLVRRSTSPWLNAQIH